MVTFKSGRRELILFYQFDQGGRQELINSWFRFFCVFVFANTNKNAITNTFTNLKVGGGSSSIVGSASSLHHPAPSSGGDGDHDDYETEDADDEDLVCTFVCGTEASQETS